jgi:cobalamin biosynthesis Mg chelatase CobN
MFAPVVHERIAQSTKASEQASRQPGPPASKQASKRAVERATERASKQTSQQASKQTSKQASKQASTPASKQASKQAVGRHEFRCDLSKQTAYASVPFIYTRGRSNLLIQVYLYKYLYLGGTVPWLA